MAILKHKTSKNTHYSDVLEYYTYKHKEDPQTGHYEPILDENGLMIERDDYAVAYITAQGTTAEPALWAAACIKTNLFFCKNLDIGDRKNHEYIIAHPDEDEITVAQLLEEGKAFVMDNLHGYDCLIGAHDNHVHITLNSVRALQREPEDWMMRNEDSGEVLRCEIVAGGKHQDSPGLRCHLNNWVLEYTRQHGYIQKDNNAIAEVHRAQRHGSKNELMRAALLEAAARIHNMLELQQIMRRDYNMTLKASGTGKTLSILYPGNEKYVRLRTLDLEPTDLTRRFLGAEYIFTQEAENQQHLIDVEAKEKRKYAEWLKEVRQRNGDKAEATIDRAEELLAQRFRGHGERYSKEEFGDIRYLIRQTTYVSSNLQTELEKVDRLLGRWSQYHSPELPPQDRRQHGNYVRWCGCDPDSTEELTALQAERDTIITQQEHADAIRDALLAEADKWKGRNVLTYRENDLLWAKQREKQLKQQLKNIRASRKKLWKIAWNCEMAAKRYDRYLQDSFGSEWGRFHNPKWDNVKKFNDKFVDALYRERECLEKVKAIKQKKMDAKAEVRQAKKNLKSLEP